MLWLPPASVSDNAIRYSLRREIASMTDNAEQGWENAEPASEHHETFNSFLYTFIYVKENYPTSCSNSTCRYDIMFGQARSLVSRQLHRRP